MRPFSLVPHRRIALPACLILLVAQLAAATAWAGDFDDFLQPLLSEKCTKCHRGKKPKGEVSLRDVDAREKLLEQPALIERLIKVLDSSDMPPEGAEPIAADERARAVAFLRKSLRDATRNERPPRARAHRLNRFQYSNAVRDLFELDRDIFRLSEKLLTRHSDYLREQRGTMPERIEASCQALEKATGLRGVVPYPKDLRAAHGFDNQADQLTLSPLLLEAFLKLSLSILESPDFRPETVGVWSELFAAPAEDADLPAEVRRRLRRFLGRAFRAPVDSATLERYVAFTIRKIRETGSFGSGMKSLASAVLSSPLFLYRYEPDGEPLDSFALASKLSFFLWATAPDEELLRLATAGMLADPEVLRSTVDRMLDDPKVERFLDTFPSQWMQLENILAATPDPRKSRYYSLDKARPAGLQMVLEPLLLFDAVFVENRPVTELLDPEFGYRSDFLEAWYGSDLEPPAVDEAAVREIHQARDAKRRELGRVLEVVRAERDGFGRVEERLFREADVKIDLAPGQARWQREQARILAEEALLSSWHRIGPFAADSFDRAHSVSFIDESKVDLGKSHAGKSWQEAPQYVDGRVHELTGANSATYLFRTIHTATARSLDVSLGSDDSFRLWLNGELIVDKKVSRGIAPDQDQVRLRLSPGENQLLLKIANGGGGHGFYFKAKLVSLPGPVVAALAAGAGQRSLEEERVLRDHYRSIAPELQAVRDEIVKRRDDVARRVREAEAALRAVPPNESLAKLRQEAQKRFENELRGKLLARTFKRVPMADPRYGGIVTNAAMLSMTSGPTRTHPIARGAWLIEVVLNDPPPPPPNDVPPLDEDAGDENLTIREKFAAHRENPDCAGCHSKLDPLGFALENFDITGRWRDSYENGRRVDSSGRLFRRHEYEGVVAFKVALVKERRRFVRAFTAHLLRFALGRELVPRDSLVVEEIVEKVATEDFRLRSIIREVILSPAFLRTY